MARIHLWVMDHRDEDWQQSGPIITPWLIDDCARPGKHYADYCVLYNVWKDIEPPEIVGFFGYRKYLYHDADDLAKWASPAHAPGWWQCTPDRFNAYRDWLSKWDGVDLLPLLAQHDILQAAPFPITDGDVIQDFMHSRSEHDAGMLMDVAIKYGIYPNPLYKIYPYLFITRWSVFDRMMREIEPIRQQLEPVIWGADSTNEAYIKRPMAYVMERVYSLWLANSGLSIKEVPLLHCWEKS